MNKTYTRINWQNAPSEATALNETNLNKMDSAIDTIDDRVVAHDTQITNLEAGKVDKEAGKGLSTNDYTTAEKTKLSNIATNATNTEFMRSYSSGIGIGTYRKNANFNTVYIPAPDTALSGSSTNYVQNKIVTSALADKVDKENGKGLCNMAYIIVDTDPDTQGDTVATITTRGQNEEYNIAWNIKNGMVAITNAEIDALA